MTAVLDALARTIPTSPPRPARPALSGAPLLIIDGAETRARDDAVAATALPGGGWQLEVHITGVADTVPAGGDTDRKAFRAARTIYRPGYTMPMLGDTIERACTLAAGSDHTTLAIRFHISPAGMITAGDDAVSGGRTARRGRILTYNSAARALSDTNHPATSRCSSCTRRRMRWPQGAEPAAQPSSTT